MARYSSKMLVLCMVLSFVLFSSWVSSTDFKEKFQKDLSEAGAAAEHLAETARSFNGENGSAADLRKALINAREEYKRIEWLIGYYFPGYASGHLNGAPLLQLSKYDTRPLVVPPEGLQVLDEMIFADSTEIDRAEVMVLSTKLVDYLQRLEPNLAQQSFSERELIEALRLEVVKIFTLGITGFDTPGSVNAISEAQVSLKAIAENSKHIEALKNSKATEMAFEAAATLQNASFDELDRMTFYKDHLAPLYRELGAAQPSGISSIAYGEAAWNPSAQSIFSENFLTPYYYSSLNEAEDGASLRELGKKLFKEKKLSAQGKISCATCHKKELAFTDAKPTATVATASGSASRNSPSLVNAVFADRYFYDLRAFNLEQQAEHVIFNHAEFSTSYRDILEKVRNDKEYQHSFKEAFGEKGVSVDKLSKALSSYVLSLQSFDSPFEQFMRGDTSKIDPKVRKGFNLFMGKGACGTCHFAPTFSGLVPPLFHHNETEILGVLKSPDTSNPELDNDPGRMANGLEVEEAWIFEKSFKTPGLKNVEFTAPYFHNGAYPTLESVIDFYDHGGGAGLGIPVTNQTLPSDSLELNTEEKQALIAFLKSLSSPAFKS